MIAKIFYAWQSDLDEKTNRYFIKECIQKAIKRIRSDLAEIQASPRPEIDHDTKGLSGSPEIVGAILDKIDASIAFIGDVSFVAKTVPLDGRTPKSLPNPNVLLEMGYAFGAVSADRVILVQNTHYGDSSGLPFDLQHRRWPIGYALPPGASKEDCKDAKSKLSDQLYAALMEIVKMPGTFGLSEDQKKLQLASEQVWGIANLLLVQLRMYMASTAVVSKAPKSVQQFLGLTNSLGPGGPGCDLEAFDHADMNEFWQTADLGLASNLNVQGRQLTLAEAIRIALTEAKQRSEAFLSRYGALHIGATTTVTHLHNMVENALLIMQIPIASNKTQDHCMVSVCQNLQGALFFVNKARREYRHELRQLDQAAVDE